MDFLNLNNKLARLLDSIPRDLFTKLWKGETPRDIAFRALSTRYTRSMTSRVHGEFTEAMEEYVKFLEDLPEIQEEKARPGKKFLQDVKISKIQVVDIPDFE